MGSQAGGWALSRWRAGASVLAGGRGVWKYSKHAVALLVFATVSHVVAVAQDRPARDLVDPAEVQGLDPVLEIALQEIERLTRELDDLDEREDSSGLEQALAANLAIAGQRLEVLGVPPSFFASAISASGGEGVIAAEMASDPGMDISEDEALAVLQELLDTDVSGLLLEIADAFRAP